MNSVQSMAKGKMGFLQAKFTDVTCRICKQSYCCKDCRCKHEEKFHQIFPECDICIYGRVPISRTRLSAKLLNHIKEKHWPLHCVHCRRIYNSTDDFEKHNHICPILSASMERVEKLNAKTPVRANQEEQNFESPPVLPMPSLVIQAVTSTPMNPEIKTIIGVPDNITPVDADRIQTDNPNQSTNISESTDNMTAKNKRKVTFVSTPAFENVRKKPKNHENFFKSSLKNSLLRQNESSQTSFPISETGRRSDSFMSASENFGEIKKEAPVTSPVEVVMKMQKTPAKKRRSASMNETLWKTALNDTFNSNENEENVNMSLNIHLGSNSKEMKDSEVDWTEESLDKNASKKTGVWSSMTSLWKNVVQGFSATEPTEDFQASKYSLKRHRSMNDCNESDMHIKRMKLCDIKCRRPIRSQTRNVKMDKSIQTDESDTPFMDF